jgi:hypothetical protein
VQVLLSTGTGFSDLPASGVALSGSMAAPVSLVLGHFDTDENLDPAVASEGANRIEVFLGNGDGTFGAGAQLVFQSHPAAIEAAKPIDIALGTIGAMRAHPALP